MSTNKGKERASSLTGSTIITVTASTVLQKNTYPRMELPDIFLGDRKKFKTYETQCRIVVGRTGTCTCYPAFSVLSASICFRALPAQLYIASIASYPAIQVIFSLHERAFYLMARSILAYHINLAITGRS
jgi:hypothetical protein